MEDREFIGKECKSVEVTIYIDAYHTGNLKKGTGTYSIVLEYINPQGKTKTREYIEGLKGTTKNRTELTACIVALSHMRKTCNIKIVTNARFVVNAVNQNWSKTKNTDLWQQLIDGMAPHNVIFEYEMTNSYSTYMFFEMEKAMKAGKIKYKEDTQIE